MLARAAVMVRASRRCGGARGALVSAATILGAFFFQYGLGFAPCPLCLEQRLSLLRRDPARADRGARGLARGAAPAGPGRPRRARAGDAAGATRSRVYHSGIEWKWWPGPQDCSGPLSPARRHGPAGATAEHQRGALRRGAVALPRPVDRRLERADLARARRRAAVGHRDRAAGDRDRVSVPAFAGDERRLSVTGTLAARITSPQRLVSSLTNLPISCGLPPPGSRWSERTSPARRAP